MFIKDMESGEVRKYGTNQHDSLIISRDGRTLRYYNLQNGYGSMFGGYVFVTDDGKIPFEDKELVRHGADAYFNIGGFEKHRAKWLLHGWMHYCTSCERANVDATNYCPNCGARMKGTDDETD